MYFHDVVEMEGVGGGPQMGEVTRGRSPHLTCTRDQLKMRDYMDRRVTPPKRLTSPTWGPPPPCKEALKETDLFGLSPVGSSDRASSL